MDARRDPIAVIRARTEALEDQQVECALQEIDLAYSHVTSPDYLGKLIKRRSTLCALNQAVTNEMCPMVGRTRAAMEQNITDSPAPPLRAPPIGRDRRRRESGARRRWPVSTRGRLPTRAASRSMRCRRTRRLGERRPPCSHPTRSLPVATTGAARSEHRVAAKQDEAILPNQLSRNSAAAAVCAAACRPGGRASACPRTRTRRFRIECRLDMADTQDGL